MGLETDTIDKLFSDSYELAAKAHQIKHLYNIPEETFSKMMTAPSVLRSVLIAEMKLRAGTINIRGTKEKFINGVLLKLTK